MFFNNKDNIKILDMLDTLESYLKDEINFLPEKNFVTTGHNKLVKNKLDSIFNILNERNNQELEIYGEIMLVAEKISNGKLDDKIHHTNTSNFKLNYIAKTINSLADTLNKNVNNILNILEEYKNENYTNKLDTSSVKNSFELLYQGINNLQNSIVEGLSDNKSRSINLEANSANLLNNVSDLTHNSTEAAASLEETAAALEEITSTVRNNTQNVEKLGSLSKTLDSSTKEGSLLANETTNAMEEMSVQIQSITEATSVIDQIAFQTNILSLNAAVEAATAGEAGKGFAVVAQEVRNLANRSADAAKEIKEIVLAATNKSNEGKVTTEKMIHGYTNLNENISEVIELISHLEVASDEQLHGIEEINRAIGQLDRQTQQNAKIADQTFDIAKEVEEHSNLIVKNTKNKRF